MCYSRWASARVIPMIRKICSIFAVCLILFFNILSHATTVERLGLEELAKRANAIVVGTVTGARTYWSAGGKLILTEYTIEVDETVKGNSGRTISVTTIGGRIGDIELHVSGMPSFQKGENAVVFVETSGAYQTVLGLEQGKFTLTNGEIGNSVSGLSFPDGRPGNPVRMPLGTFKAQIRNFLSRP